MIDSILSALRDPSPSPLAALLELEFKPEMIGLFIPLAGLLFALAIVIANMVSEAHKRRLKHETIRFALEKGQPLPPDAFQDRSTDPAALVSAATGAQAAERRARDDRRTGLILICVAAGTFIGLRAVRTGGAEWFAAIPGLIGVAFLINWAIERSERSAPPSPSEPHR